MAAEDLIKYAAAPHLDNFVLLIPPAEAVRGQGDPLQWTYYLLLWQLIQLFPVGRILLPFPHCM